MLTRTPTAPLPARSLFMIAAAAVGSLAAAPTLAQPLPDPIPETIADDGATIRLRLVASELTAPNWGTTAPGHPDLLFIVDQDGQIYAVNVATGARVLFLDVASRLVSLGVSGPGSFDERGFLGLAFHPDYATNGLFYTYESQPVAGPADFSTMPVGAAPNHQAVITEWQVPDPGAAPDANDPTSLPDIASARTVLRIDEPQFNHNGGALNFGPDGFLYISFGDGGGRDDEGAGHVPGGNGQDFNNPLGKILRIDPTGNNSASGNYGVPASNPFVNAPGLDEVFAYGLRNPFRFSFDPATGELWVGDVGQGAIEEVNIITPGGNYGWPVKEGTFLFNGNGNNPGFVFADSPGAPAGLIDPVAQYDHDEGISVIGGFVYRGARLVGLQGRYIFGDFGTGPGRLFHLDAQGDIHEFQYAGNAFGLRLLGFGRDSQGELYVLANGTGTPFGGTGVVLRIEPACAADATLDGTADASDITAFLAAWFADRAGDPANADFNGDGDADASDITAFLAAWFEARAGGAGC